MNRPNESVMAVQALLKDGETSSGPLESLSAGLRFGLWFCTTDGKRCVASAVLAHLAASLPNRDEATAALFACEDRYRASWWPLVAARFRDAGRRRHLPELCMGIDQVGPASAAVRTLLPQAALKATGFGELETLLFGAPADQAVVWPVLLRIMGATAALVEGGQGQPVDLLPAVDFLDPPCCWRRDRILQLPRIVDDGQADLRFVLNGHCGPLSEKELVPDDPLGQAVMRWVLYRPWVLMLAQVAFVQEAWVAEQISGRLALELADDQMANPYQPGRVDVVVTTPEGDEILCGTVGDLLRRVLGRLGITLLARPEEVRQLDDLLRL